jgi:hypothetical protein
MTPEEFDRMFDGAFAKWVRDRAQSLLTAYFPLAVIDRLRASSVSAPTLLFEPLKRLETETEAEQSSTQDLFRLLADEGCFDGSADD